MSSSALRRTIPYARPHVRRIAGVVILGSFVGMLASSSIPLVVKRAIDGPLAQGTTDGLLGLGLLAIVLGAVDFLAGMIRRRSSNQISNDIETTMRNELYAHLQRLPVAFHDGWQSGQLLSRAMTDISVVRRFLGFGLVYLVISVAQVAVIGVFLARLHVWMAVVAIGAMLPLSVFVRGFNRRYRKVSRRLQDQEGDLTTLVEESATGIRVVKAFGRHREVTARYLAQARVVRSLNLEKTHHRAGLYRALNIVPNVSLALVLCGGALAVGRGSMTVGGLVAFVSLLGGLVWPIESMGEIVAMAEEAETAAQRIFEVLDTEPEVHDRPAARAHTVAEGRLRFEGVDFAYPGISGHVLEGVDLDVAPGETIAVVGATGSGKTTLVSLVPRLYDVTGGRITIDGVDLRDMTLDSLRAQVGVAFEDPVLFSASVRENLVLGCPDATDDDVAHAVETAQATFVHDLPWGLDTRIGEQGLSLSGGQRQRLALARAVIGRPRLLVLDDPLSALDVHTEALVEEALRTVLAGVTALVVVHRPSTVALADRVAFLDGGRIAAVGTHSELLASVPRYRAVLSQEADATGAVRTGAGAHRARDARDEDVA